LVLAFAVLALLSSGFRSVKASVLIDGNTDSTKKIQAERLPKLDP
jgi:hypothetical protein